MYLKRILQGLMAAAMMIPVSAEARDLRVLSSWGDNYEPVPLVFDPFLRKIEEATGGDLALKRFGPETIPPFEQLDPVSRGLFDMLITNGAYHYNDTSVAMSLDALVGTAGELREAGLWDFVDQHYQDRGLKLIAVLYDHNGYHIMLKEPLTGNALEGRKIRGTPIYHPIIETLGGSPVVLPGGEIYPALERGVVEGAAWPTIGAVGFRWYEVASYMMRPSFGQVGYPVFMSLDTWNSLTEEQQTAVADAAAAYEVEAAATFDEIVAKEVETLGEKGMTVTELGEEHLGKLNTAWFQGAIDLAAQKDPEAIATLKDIAAKGGLSPQ